MKFLKTLPVLAGAAVLLSACADEIVQPTPSDSLLRAGSANLAIAPEFVRSDLETTGNHIVVMNGNRLPGNFAARVSRIGGSVEASYPQLGIAVVAGLDDAAAASLQEADDVKVVEPDFLMPLVDPVREMQVEAADIASSVAHHDPANAFRFARQWHLRAIDADRAWDAGFTGSPTVTVAILDTGLDYLHVDVAGLVDMERSRSFVPADDARVDAWFPGEPHFIDLHWHGTHVGATVSSNAVAAAGVTAHTTLVGVKVCNVFGSCPTSSVLAGIMYASDIDADVMNLSLGGLFLKSLNPGFVSVINRAITYANRAGTVVVVAAGNSNVDLDRNIFQGVHYPDLYASYCDGPTTVCVSATGPTSSEGVDGPWENVDTKAGYSNFGRSAIDVAAPGGAAGGPVWAACSRFSMQIPVCQTGNFILGASGTSMASPHAAGVAALIVEQIGPNRPGQVRQRLHQTADAVEGRGNHPYFGKGRINAYNAVGGGQPALGGGQDREQGQARGRM